MDRLENKMGMYFAIILVLLFAILGTNCLVLARINDAITAIEDNKEAWDEASIIVDSKEIVRGQIDYYYINDNDEMTLYFSNGEVWTTRAANVILQHHNAR
jgi:hypothetical protein